MGRLSCCGLNWLLAACGGFDDSPGLPTRKRRLAGFDQRRTGLTLVPWFFYDWFCLPLVRVLNRVQVIRGGQQAAPGHWRGLARPLRTHLPRQREIWPNGWTPNLSYFVPIGQFPTRLRRGHYAAEPGCSKVGRFMPSRIDVDADYAQARAALLI